MHYIPKSEEGDGERNKERIREWYTGQVYYSIKDMTTEGSSAVRGAAELSKALEEEYGDLIPSRLYLYTDGGGDRNDTHFKVQKSLMALFMMHDLDEIVSAPQPQVIPTGTLLRDVIVYPTWDCNPLQ